MNFSHNCTTIFLLFFGVLLTTSYFPNFKLKSNAIQFTENLELENYILGGQPDTTDEKGSSVGIYIPSHGRLCTGVIISGTEIITAAHCFEDVYPNEQVEVRFGKDIENGYISIPVAFRHNHSKAEKCDPVYFCPPDSVDLAYVELAGKIPKGYLVTQILNSKQHLPVGTKVVTEGFGLTRLNDPSSVGKLHIGTARVTDLNFDSNSTNFHTSDDTQGCANGDSGGPAYVVSKNGDILLAGICTTSYYDGSKYSGYVKHTEILNLLSEIKEVKKSIREQQKEIKAGRRKFVLI